MKASGHEVEDRFVASQHSTLTISGKKRIKGLGGLPLRNKNAGLLKFWGHSVVYRKINTCQETHIFINFVRSRRNGNILKYAVVKASLN